MMLRNVSFKFHINCFITYTTWSYLSILWYGSLISLQTKVDFRDIGIAKFIYY